MTFVKRNLFMFILLLVVGSVSGVLIFMVLSSSKQVVLKQGNFKEIKGKLTRFSNSSVLLTKKNVDQSQANVDFIKEQTKALFATTLTNRHGNCFRP